MSAINEATLYWDSDGGAGDVGWVLWYKDAAGQEEFVDVGETEDASIETLAHQMADCAPDGATGTVHVVNAGRQRGTIVLKDGAIETWMALRSARQARDGADARAVRPSGGLGRARLESRGRAVREVRPVLRGGLTVPCCPHTVERHAYNGCADCGCACRWVDHPERERDTSPAGRSAIAYRNHVVWVTLPDGGRDRMPRHRAIELGLKEE